ncbi:hypothetical protein ES705_32512 [subsurface metagenome]
MEAQQPVNKKINARTYYQKNRADILYYGLIYRLNHAEELKEYADRYRREHREELRKKALVYARSHRKERKEYVRQRYLKHREEINRFCLNRLDELSGGSGASSV